jgi:hypothetical protein
MMSVDVISIRHQHIIWSFDTIYCSEVFPVSYDSIVLCCFITRLHSLNLVLHDKDMQAYDTEVLCYVLDPLPEQSPLH